MEEIRKCQFKLGLYPSLSCPTRHNIIRKR